MEKTYKLQWTKSAKDDLLDIVTRIKQESPNTAVEIYQRLKKRAQSSNFFPLKGRVVPELLDEGITYYRELIEKPWRIIYRVGDETVYLIAIIDSRQNLDELLLRKILSK